MSTRFASGTAFDQMNVI